MIHFGISCNRMLNIDGFIGGKLTGIVGCIYLCGYQLLVIFIDHKSFVFFVLTENYAERIYLIIFYRGLA